MVSKSTCRRRNLNHKTYSSNNETEAHGLPCSCFRTGATSVIKTYSESQASLSYNVPVQIADISCVKLPYHQYSSHIMKKKMPII